MLEFLAEYGERAYIVLRAAVDAAFHAPRHGLRLGDFSYREVAARLKAWGIDYNPSMLLRALERDYGVIETSYRSGSQHWWRFLDSSAVLDALEMYERGVSPTEERGGDGEVDVELNVLLAQIASLQPYSVLEALRRMAAKPRLGRGEILQLRRIAFNELELAARLLEKAEELGYEGEEVRVLKRIVELAGILARRLLASAGAEEAAKHTLMQIAYTSTGRGVSLPGRPRQG